MIVGGITQSMYSSFGIPSFLTNNMSAASNNFTFDLICPEIVSPTI